MAAAKYERLPTSPDTTSQSTDYPPSDTQLEYDLDEEEANIGRPPPPRRVVYARDPRFDIPTPPHWQRAGLLLFIVFLFWLGYKLRGSPEEEGIPAITE